MRTVLVSSPAYRANGCNGTYCSVAICNNNGKIVEIIGDHASLASAHEYVDELKGLPHTDADRFISLQDVKFDIDKVRELHAVRVKEDAMFDEWVNACAAVKENFVEWHKKNPYPKRTVEDYAFLKCRL
jgi:hypothetical protein